LCIFGEKENVGESFGESSGENPIIRSDKPLKQHYPVNSPVLLQCMINDNKSGLTTIKIPVFYWAELSYPTSSKWAAELCRKVWQLAFNKPSMRSNSSDI